MALTYAEIIDLAGQEAKVPGFTSQAGLHLNMILEDLALNNNLDIRHNDTYTIAVTGGLPAGGPYALPADYLRHVADEVRFVDRGIPFNLYQKPLKDYKTFITGPGIGAYPEFFSIDIGDNGANIFFWPPPDGAYTIEFPYYQKHVYETDPANSTNVPWFPMSSYLIKELTARLTSGNDDNRSEKLSYEAKEMLKGYLTMKDDKEGYAQQIGLDRNNFSARGRLRGTKQNPWG
jgi:hypothetical protein